MTAFSSSSPSSVSGQDRSRRRLYPDTERGHGLGFCANLAENTICINDAHGSASTKTYYEDGYWTKALADKSDYMLIQFGHNDEESALHPARETNLQTG